MMMQGDPPGNWYALGWVFRYIETLCKSFAESFGRSMSISVLRPTLIYGEHDHFDTESAHFLPSMIRRVVARERPIEVWGDGLQKRDLVHAEDVVRASLLSLDHCNGFDVFNVASGQSHTVNEVLDAILRIDGFDDADIRHVNAGPTTLSERRFDGDKARRLLNFQPAIGLDAGLRRTIGWYRGTAEAG